MLAGAQLGITLCSLGPRRGRQAGGGGPAGSPVFRLVSVPDRGGIRLAVILAVAIVVFLHMVVGEMAPKSWAISHPERRAAAGPPLPVVHLDLAPDAAGCSTGWPTAACGSSACTPQDELAQVHGPKELAAAARELPATHGHARGAGAPRPRRRHRPRHDAADRGHGPARPRGRASHDRPSAPRPRRVSRDTGRSRLVVTRGRHAGRHRPRARHRACPPRRAPSRRVTAPRDPRRRRSSRSSTPSVGDAGRSTPSSSSSTAPAGPVGLVTMEDLLERVLGQFDDETDA